MRTVCFLAMMTCSFGLKLNRMRSDVLSSENSASSAASSYTFTLHGGGTCAAHGAERVVIRESGQNDVVEVLETDGSGTSVTVSTASIQIDFTNDKDDGTCDRNVFLTYSDGSFVASFPSRFKASSWDCDGNPSEGNLKRCNMVKGGTFAWEGSYYITFTHVAASGDPKAVNARGETFDIQRLGTFTFLSVTNTSDSHSAGVPLMSLDATVGRAGPSCDHTYILNCTLSGSWIQESNPTKIEIRAVPDERKDRALEIFFKDEWHKLSEIRKDRGQTNTKDLDILQKATAEALALDVHGVKFVVSIGAHRIRPTTKYANFLNVDVKGMNKFIGRGGIHLDGLLAYDDHAFAAQAPDDCKVHSEKRQLLLKDTDFQPALMSMMRVSP